MKPNFKTKLYDLLKKDSRLWDEKKKELNETLLKDLIDKLDEKLIELLLSEKETKEKFFIKVKDVFVFKQNELKFFIDENKLDNSYTQYQNKIGLRVGNKLLSERDEVVLNWPFKDCVLEGGMTKEDQKRNEIFFNEILAKSEIDRLFDPKALKNWKRYTAKGEEKFRELRRDKDGTIRENLIIKGNNLLALHSLKDQFTGKVKLIYIDPPYYFKDTKTDDVFAYNSNFKLSTWLTFMKNRLEVARDLLSDDGVIYIQINDEGFAHLKILMDEIYKNNFVNAIIVKMSDLSGPKMAHLDKKFPKLKENILLYKKSKINLNKITVLKDKWDNEYKNYLENFEEEDYKLVNIFDFEKDSLEELNKKLKKVKIIPLSKKLEELDLDNLNKVDREKVIFDFCMENSFRIARTSNSSSLKIILDKIIGKYDQKIIGVKSPSGNLALCITSYDIKAKDPRVQIVFSKDTLETPLGDLWLDINTSGLHTEGGVKLENGKKPEKLLYYIIKSATKKGDIILDYHLGSGTTCAVAHKMGRQYIGIEQLDYGGNDSVVRLNNVIKGDQSGISKSVDWQSGGDFVYLELAKWNEEAKEKILEAKSLSELEKLFDELYERYFLNYNVKTKEFKEKILKEKEFKKLSLAEQKNLFVEMLDMNQMYVNFSEREDKKYNLAKEDIILSEEFYQYRK